VRGRNAWGGKRLTLTLLLCGLFLLPLAFMVTGSLRTPGLPPPDGFEWLPSPLRVSNYETIFLFVPLWTFLRNSLIVVAIAVPVTVLVASLAGFVIATADAGTRKVLIVLSLVALMIPVTALWVPRFALFRWVGLIDTLVPLMAPALMATTPFYVLLFALAYARLPRALFEAARLEGLSPAQIWRKVAWPLGKPVAFAVAVLAFAFHWSNFIDPLLYLSSEESYTVSLGLRSLAALEPTNHPILLAASVVAAAPPVIAFLIAQRSFYRDALEV
jgi:multiple sugar transport system permease protein